MASQREIDRLIKLANKNLCEGIREEPRILHDRIPFWFQAFPPPGAPPFGSVQSNGDFNSYVNGERWPLRVTHLVISLGQNYLGPGAKVFQCDPPLPIQLLQLINMRVRHHDIYYMAEQLLPATAWMNKVTSVPNELGYAAASWTFDRPVVLSARDQLYVEVQALFDQISGEGFSPTDYESLVSVSFSGVGVQSERPYFFGATVTLEDSTPTIFQPGNLQNVGLEPVALTDMAFQARLKAVLDLPEPDPFFNVPSDVRAYALQVRQIGNGTNANWFAGPSIPTPIARANASLIGTESGPAVVHRLPGDGILLEPGEGLRIEAALNGITTYLNQNQENPIDLIVGLSGYLVVT